MSTLSKQTVDSEIQSHQDVVLYPTFGHLDRDGCGWRVTVAGLVSDPGPDRLRRRIFQRLIRQLVKVPREQLEGELFQQRLHGFLAVPERGMQIAVRLGNHTRVLEKRSRRNGHFRGSLYLTSDEVLQLERAGAIADGWIQVDVVTPPGDTRRIAGQTQLIGQTGLSIISDIDDTIKHSDVRHKKALLANTFLREFREVPGMPQIFQRWAELGAAFHYVSSSPWQLYDALTDLLRQAGFPPGSMHLRAVRLRDPSVLRLFIARRLGKRRMIASIIRSFPHRRFILVGDTGEKDPEIYGSITRRFPSQISRILIREISGRPMTSERADRAFRGVSPLRWNIFREGNELADLVAADEVLCTTFGRPT